jgi:hypothetical protein
MVADNKSHTAGGRESKILKLEGKTATSHMTKA